MATLDRTPSLTLRRSAPCRRPRDGLRGGADVADRPKEGSRRPACYEIPLATSQLRAAFGPLLRIAKVARSAPGVRSPAQAWRALRALEDVEEVVTAPKFEHPVEQFVRLRLMRDSPAMLRELQVVE